MLRATRRVLADLAIVALSLALASFWVLGSPIPWLRTSAGSKILPLVALLLVGVTIGSVLQTMSGVSRPQSVFIGRVLSMTVTGGLVFFAALAIWNDMYFSRHLVVWSLLIGLGGLIALDAATYYLNRGPPAQ